MTDHNTLIDSIRTVLDEQLNVSRMAEFHAQARLNEDLYLDSVLVLQLLIGLEAELGIDLPDEALQQEDFATVASLAHFLASQMQGDSEDILQDNSQDNFQDSLQNGFQKKPKEHTLSTAIENNDSEQPIEEFEDIKVHCFVSCLCEIIKANDSVDHRPFYFGVWDAEVVIDPYWHINYHSPDLNHDFFKRWYQRLYGVDVTPWYSSSVSKFENVQQLVKLLETKTSDQQVMVMLDMYRLPERENKFNQNPFPHYVLLENSDDSNVIFMRDPDFRWEGPQDRSQVLHAIESDAVAGGYMFDRQQIRASDNRIIRDYFLACYRSDNPMTNSVRRIVQAHIDGVEQLSVSGLASALDQLPILAIRKYAYEHGFAFFWRALELDNQDSGSQDSDKQDSDKNSFEDWCDIVECLVSGYKSIQFVVMKMAANFSKGQDVSTLQQDVMQRLQQQDQWEYQLKQGLWEVYRQWCQRHQLNPSGDTTSESTQKVTSAEALV